MTKSYFFVGIGGSGMLPLAQIVAARGDRVAGSDRALDQGRLSEKFDALRAQGVGLFAQDGSGVTSTEQIVVTSAAIEDEVPDVVRALELGCTRLTRAELLAQLFDAATIGIAVGGTSGKSTVTGMIGHILSAAGRDPTVMNGALMKNFGSGSVVGKGPVFVSEVDESDGSIALYRPTVGVLTNVAVDHKPIEELRRLFAGFFGATRSAVVNADNREAMRVATGRQGVTVSFGIGTGDIEASGIVVRHDGTNFTARHGDNAVSVSLPVPGRHNVSNALAALAAAMLVGVRLVDGAAALASYRGLARRMDVIGTANGVTVIDDFGHNPDKIAATLSTLHAFPGRLLVFFQPHGFGPLKKMARELGESFAANLERDDRVIVGDPAYYGGTTDRSVGSDTLVAMIGARAEHIADRVACGERLISLAQTGDRIVVMGARDDTLSLFAADLLARLGTA